MRFRYFVDNHEVDFAAYEALISQPSAIRLTHHLIALPTFPYFEPYDIDLIEAIREWALDNQYPFHSITYVDTNVGVCFVHDTDFYIILPTVTDQTLFRLRWADDIEF